MKLLIPLALALAAWLPAVNGAAGLQSSISGIVWDDVNMDGRRQADEPGLPRVSLALSGPKSATAQTAADGSYSFTGLPKGSYRISLGYAGMPFVSTYPAKILQGEIEAGVSLGDVSSAGLDFGLVRVDSGVAAPGDPARRLPSVSGLAWVEAVREPNPDVRGFVDGQQCGFKPAFLVSPTDIGPGYYSLFFVPEQLVPGCGAAGRAITFTINGRPANEVVTWPPTVGNLELTAGPPFAVFQGNLSVPIREGRAVIGEGKVTATIQGKVCSEQFFVFGPYEVSVLPESLRPGCGVQGATVEFFLDGVKARETALWTPGFHRLDLTIPDVGQPFGTGGIRAPDTGDGGLRR